jgi:hypothetical protein
MLAIIPGTIAGSAFTKSADQVPYVVTQATFGYCLYMSYTGANPLRHCLWETSPPAGAYTLLMMNTGYAGVAMGERVAKIGAKWRWQDDVRRGKPIVMQGSRILQFSPIGATIVAA